MNFENINIGEEYTIDRENGYYIYTVISKNNNIQHGGYHYYFKNILCSVRTKTGRTLENFLLTFKQNLETGEFTARDLKPL